MIYEICSIALALVLTFLLIKLWITLAHRRGIVGQDIHKVGVAVAESGGIVTSCVFIFVCLLILLYESIFLKVTTDIAFIFAICISILLATMLGFTDDILGWKIGLNQVSKFVLSFLICLPMMIINLGVSSMHFPIIGRVDLGIYYPLIMIPLIMMFTTNIFNTLGGFNGLESSMGILIVGALSFFSYHVGHTYLAYIGGLYVVIMIAFYYFNMFPASIFPGDSFTYSTGAMIGILAILGNIETIAGIILIPYFIEAVLKLRGGLKKESFGQLYDDGSIRNRYDKWYGIEHIAISLNNKLFKRTTEWSIVFTIMFFEICCIAVSVIAYG